MISVINLLILSYVTFSQSIVLLSDSNTQAVELLFACLENFLCFVLTGFIWWKGRHAIRNFSKNAVAYNSLGLVSGMHGLPFQS